MSSLTQMVHQINTVPNSLVKTDFQEYVFTAGVNDDGIGTPLDDFIQFQIKIVMQGTDATKPVRIKDFRQYRTINIMDR